MQRSILLLFTLCGLLWPSAGHSQDPVITPGTDPNLRFRYAFDARREPGISSEEDTLFVDWVTVYAKPEDATSTLATGTPATRYWINFGRRLAGQDEFENVEFFSLASPPSLYNGGRFYDAHVRRDTLLLELVDGYEYLAGFPVVFPDGSEYLGDFSSPVYVSDLSAFATLSVDRTFIREDAGATTIEIKAQLQGQRTAYRDIHVTPITLPPREGSGGLNYLFYLDAPTLVIERDKSSATGQMTLTPIDDNVRGYPEFGGEEDDTDFRITIGAQGERHQRAYIRLLDDDSPTTEIELTVSDPTISTDGRATDVTVTGTLNGALLDESVSFPLGVMPPTTAARDTDFGIRLARLTIPAGQATGTATVRVTPQNQNGGQIWLGVAEHPSIGTGSNQRIIVVKEAAIELTKQPSGVIADIKAILFIREDAGQLSVDLKISLKEALPVDETIRFEIVGECGDDLVPCWEGFDIARRETDYSAELSPLAIPAGQKEAVGTLSLEIADNNNADRPRVIWVMATLGNSRFATSIVIEDDETPTSWVLLSTDVSEIAEDSGQTTITITGTLAGSPLNQPLTIVLSAEEFHSNLAIRDLDYTADFESLVIPAGQTEGTATLTITPTPNDGKEQDKILVIAPVGPGDGVKIVEDGQEREIRVTGVRITLKDVADAPASVTQTEEGPSSLAFDAPASTILSGTVGEALSEVLPTATSDPEGELTYRVFNLPAGLTFDATTRTITGEPTTVGQTSIEYYALSEGVSPAVLTYTIDVQEKPKVIVELGGIAATPDSIREDAGEAATVTLTVSLRKAAKEDAVIALAIVGPTEGKTAKLNEDFTATLPTTITIPAGKTKGTAEITVLPKDNTTADGNKALAVQATSPSGHQAQIDIQIIDNETASTTASADDDSTTPDSDEDGSQAEDSGEDSEDTFAFASTVDDPAYTEGTEIPALVLPEATGGEGDVTYRVFDLPAGLAFDAATRTISGTPTAATDGAVEITCLAEDSAGAVATLTFSITVNPPMSFGDLSDLFGTGGG